MAGFNYSAALKGKGGPWTYEDMNAWLAKPYQLADLLAAVRGQIASPTILARSV